MDVVAAIVMRKLSWISQGVNLSHFFHPSALLFITVKMLLQIPKGLLIQVKLSNRNESLHIQ